MRRSVLSYRRETTGEGRRGTLIALHGYGASSAQLMSLAHLIGNGFRIYAPDGPQPVSPAMGLTSNGRLWFAAQTPCTPEPVLFGESLCQVEQFLLDVLDDVRPESEGSPVYLLGFGQGALLALCVSRIWPEVLSGVAAIEGCLPRIRGWALPDVPLGGLPVLLVNDREGAVPAALVLEAEAGMRAAGAQVRAENFAGARDLAPALSALIANWLPVQGEGGQGGPSGTTA